MYCHKCGKPLADGAVFCSYCGQPVPVPGGAPSRAPVASIPADPAGIVARIRRNEIIINVLWFALGVVQLVFLYTAAAGAWNIVIAILALCNVKNITVGNPNVVPYYDSRKTGLIVAGVVNVVLGGVVGVLLTLYSLRVRQFVLNNAGAFDPAAIPVASRVADSAAEKSGYKFAPISCPACGEHYTIRCNTAVAERGNIRFRCPKCKKTSVVSFTV